MSETAIGPRRQVLFVPGDPAREGRLAVLGEGPDEVEVVRRAGSAVRRARQPARLLPVREALPELLALAGSPDAGPEVEAWSTAAVAGAGLIARGLLHPGASATDADEWRAGPLGPEETAWLAELAAAFPATAHALPLPGTRPLRVHSADWLVRRFWDALADTLVRTPAAGVRYGSVAYTEPGGEAIDVSEYATWLAQVERDRGGGPRLILRVTPPTPAAAEPAAGSAAPAAGPSTGMAPAEAASGVSAPELAAGPGRAAAEAAAGERGAGPAASGGGVVVEAGDGDERFRAVLQVRSARDPSLILDAAELWRATPGVLAAFGGSPEHDALIAMRRAARAWPRLQPLLRTAAPTELELGDDDLEELFGPAAQALESAGAEVLWPAELTRGGLTARASATAAPAADGGPGGLSLKQLLRFRWRVALAGEELTPAEIAELAEAKRPLVRLRGQWVRVDSELIKRVRSRRGGTISAADALAAALSGRLEVADETVEFAAEGGLAGLATRLRGLAEPAAELPRPPGLLATLRPYQRRGLTWLAAMCELGLGGCLADDMGLGKTVQLIALHLHRLRLRAGPTLVVCPTSLLGNWEREIRRFAPGVPVRRYHGGDRHLDELTGEEIVLATYGVVRRDAPALAETGWGLVVADEAQHVKNPYAQGAKALRMIPATARVALTGTPVENRLTELWSILDWTTPGLLGPLDGFRRKVAVPVERYRSPEATERLATLVRPFLLRRRKSDPGIAPELPGKTETDRHVPLTAEQATLYEAVVREGLAAIQEENGMARRGLVLKMLGALKQIGNHPAQYLGQDAPLAGRSGKLAALDELLEVIVSEGESALVFSQYVGMTRLLEAHLAARGVPTLQLHGGLSAKRREELVRRFQDGEAPVFLLSLKAAGVGLNLTRASHVVHYDRWWNPAVEDQATDRAYRIGQDRPVQVHRLICEGTVEERVAELLESKRALSEAVVGAGESWITELSDGDLADLVRLGRAA
ncbi:MAG: ATP-dependent helicase [Streptosporangiales bacterium]|nr:ATP-dependent helicase [Streptosporangiales bacterium]